MSQIATRILGIESSCDETAAAVVESGERILSSVVASQFDIHRKYGGVVPELASREHLRQIVPVVREALEQAHLAYREVDAIAVTQGPGLVGSLLVGLTYGKSLAWALSKPLIAVHHLEGHVHAVVLEEKQKHPGAMIPFPAMTLVVSGGHTVLYFVESQPLAGHDDAACFSYQKIAQTQDDAAGEAYDKVAKILALGYPGGPIIDRLSEFGDPNKVAFTRAVIKRGPPADDTGPRFHRGGRSRYDFSFSGIKTAVLRYVRTHGMEAEAEERRRMGAGKPDAERLRALSSQATLDLVASFQKSVVDDLVTRTLDAAEEYDTRTVLVSGGVAANRLLRATFEQECRIRGLRVYFPSRHLSTDNAAMIAAGAYPKFLSRNFADLELNADASLPLG
ncbi:MAG TPA: tRNA (adenosine(37)-N6)-threonylcarbamoyltransferase complex transferase subunit TsaD [Candidatus Acidoferrales bacterium]